MKKIIITSILCCLFLGISQAYESCIHELLTSEHERRNDVYFQKVENIVKKVGDLSPSLRLKVIKKLETLNTANEFPNFTIKQKTVLNDINDALNPILINTLKSEIIEDYDVVYDEESMVTLYKDHDIQQINPTSNAPVPQGQFSGENSGIYDLTNLSEDIKVVFVTGYYEGQAHEYQNSFQGQRITKQDMLRYFELRKNKDYQGVSSMINDYITRGISLVPFTDTWGINRGAITIASNLLSAEQTTHGVRGLGRGIAGGSPEYYLRYMTVAGDKMYYMIEVIDLFNTLNTNWNPDHITRHKETTESSFLELQNNCKAWEHRNLCDNCNKYFINRLEGKITSQYFLDLRENFLEKIDNLY